MLYNFIEFFQIKEVKQLQPKINLPKMLKDNQLKQLPHNSTDNKSKTYIHFAKNIYELIYVNII